MSPIYGYDFLYFRLRPYVDLTTWDSYLKCVVQGRENIPQDGAVIFAPNHCNALMDALVVLRANKGATVFGARADAFTPTFAKALTFLKILPMVRKRDGLRNVLKNIDTMDKIVDVLEHDVPFCMFSEGTHRTMHSLLPLTKGIFRIAMTANARFGDSKPVYIVPVGLEYGDYYRYRSTSLVTFGKPINVTREMKSLEGESETHIFQTMRDMLSERIAGLITWIRDDGDYDAKWILTKAASIRKGSLSERMERNRETLARLERIQEKNPAACASLFKDALEFEKTRMSAGISYASFNARHPFARIALKKLAAIAGLPYFIFCAAASLPMWAGAVLIKSRMKDKAFNNTVCFGIKLGMTPVMFAVWAALYFTLMPWQYALAAFLLSIPSYNFTYDYIHFARILISDIKLFFNSKVRKAHSDLTEKLEKADRTGNA